MSDSCCLIRPLESDSEFSLPKQRSKVVAHKPSRIQYCGGPGDAHPTHSSSQLATPLSQWIFQGTSSGTRSTPHPWTYRPRPPTSSLLPKRFWSQMACHRRSYIRTSGISHISNMGDRRSISSGKNRWKMMSEVFGEWGNGFKVNPQTWML